MASGLFILSGDVFQLLQGHFDAAAADDGEFPVLLRRHWLRKTGKEDLQTAASDLGERHFALGGKGFGTLVEFVRKLNLRPCHDVESTLHWNAVNVAVLRYSPKVGPVDFVR